MEQCRKAQTGHSHVKLMNGALCVASGQAPRIGTKLEDLNGPKMTDDRHSLLKADGNDIQLCSSEAARIFYLNVHKDTRSNAPLHSCYHQ